MNLKIYTLVLSKEDIEVLLKELQGLDIATLGLREIEQDDDTVIFNLHYYAKNNSSNE